MKIEKFEGIESWQKAHELARQIYTISNDGPFALGFGLQSQIHQPWVFIMSNIAEVFEHGSNKEFIQFLFLAKGSAGDVGTQLYVALAQEYITQQVFSLLSQHITEISRMISALASYLSSSEMRGAQQ